MVDNLLYEISFNHEELEVLLSRIAEMQDVLNDMEKEGFQHVQELRHVSAVATKKINEAFSDGLTKIKMHYIEFYLLLFFVETGRDFSEIAAKEIVRERYGDLYLSILYKLKDVCNNHKPEIEKYEKLPVEERVAFLKANCFVTDEEHEEGIMLLENYRGGIKYAADILRKNFKKNIALMEVYRITPYELKIEVNEQENIGVAALSILEEDPDGQLTVITADIYLDISHDEDREQWKAIGNISGIYVHIVDTVFGIYEAADTHDQELFNCIDAVLDTEQQLNFHRRLKTGIFYIQNVFINEEYRGRGIGKVVVPVFLIRSVRSASIATAYTEDETQKHFLSSIGFESVRGCGVWAINL